MDDAAVSPKESVWALHCRSMLLWNSCIRQKIEGLNEKEKAEFAIEAWRESLAIQDSLEIHVCSSNTALSHSSREYLYKSAHLSPLPGIQALMLIQYPYVHHYRVSTVSYSLQHTRLDI